MGWKYPSDSSGHEDSVFSKFDGLATTILDACGVVDKVNNIEFKCNPSISLQSNLRSNTSKPDCYGIRRNASQVLDPSTNKWQPQWLDVAVPGEFKKDNKHVTFSDVTLPHFSNKTSPHTDVSYLPGRH